MSDLISRCELFNKLATIPAPPEANELKAQIYAVIQSMETFEIVRCKECKYGQYRADYDDYGCYESRRGLVHDANFYCADGERRKP